MRVRLQWVALGLAFALVGGVCLWYDVMVRGAWYARSFAVALGDVDGDGDLDAFVANGHTDDRGEEDAVWWNDGSGIFSHSGQRLGNNTYDSRAVGLGDLDGDGGFDAFVGNHNGYSTVWLSDERGNMTGNGQRLFTKDTVNGRHTSLGFYSHSVGLGDLDGDGDLDAFVAQCCRTSGPDRRGGTEPYNMVWVNDGSGQFTDSGQRLGPLQSHSVALGDVDGDGDLDAFVANGHAPYLGEPNKVWLNDGRGTFADSGQRLGHPVFNSDDSRAVALGDLDGDGDLDALVGNSGADQVWLNDGAGTFVHADQSLGGAHTQKLALGDLDGDGDLDAVADHVSGTVVWLNDGSGSFMDSGQRLDHSDRHVVALGDVDGDGSPDVLVVSYDRGYCVWRNDGTGRLRPGNCRRRVSPRMVGAGVAVLTVCLLGGWSLWRRYRNRGGG